MTTVLAAIPFDEATAPKPGPGPRRPAPFGDAAPTPAAAPPPTLQAGPEGDARGPRPSAGDRR